jgi:hypothetical protein
MTRTGQEVTCDKRPPKSQPTPSSARQDRMQERQPIRETTSRVQSQTAQPSVQPVQRVPDQRAPSTTPVGAVKSLRDKINPSKPSESLANEKATEGHDETHGVGRPTTNQVIKNLKITKKKQDKPLGTGSSVTGRQDRPITSTSSGSTPGNMFPPRSRSSNELAGTSTAQMASTSRSTVSALKTGPFALPGLFTHSAGPYSGPRPPISAASSNNQDYAAASTSLRSASATVLPSHSGSSGATYHTNAADITSHSAFVASMTGSALFVTSDSLSSVYTKSPQPATSTTSPRSRPEPNSNNRLPFPAYQPPLVSSSSRQPPAPSSSKQVVPVEQYQASQAENQKLKERIERLERQQQEDRRAYEKREQERHAEMINTVDRAVRDTLPAAIQDYSRSAFTIEAGPSSRRLPLPRDDQHLVCRCSLS